MRKGPEYDKSGFYILSPRITACMTCGAPVRIGVHKSFSYDTRTFYIEPLAHQVIAARLADTLFSHPKLVQIRKRLSCDDLITVVKVLSENDTAIDAAIRKLGEGHGRNT